MPKISVIIPIYNAEPYLRQCLDSIKDQTFRDIEVLCVNDGSTDDSLKIMQEYATEDARFTVFDKPNGGYGHSLNYGLSYARGEYIAIVEPDDFIDSHMYEDLSRLSVLADGSLADIVKGAYWEYYDAKDGYNSSIVAPNLLRFMPKEPVVFSLREDPEVFCHHPSIWSAIYRRDFLERNDIHFVEPKGAGWADNPFLVQTLVLAESIVWVPGCYYYYRQTNTGSSSFLKDYHVPFDRLREMRAFLDTRSDISDDILAVFYRREFDYINSVIGEFGFDEADPEIQSLISETLSSMKSDVVLTNPRMRPDDIRYYVEFNEVSDPTDDGKIEVDAVENPLLTIVVPLKNDRPYLSKTITSIAEYAGGSYEVLFVDCGSMDRSKVLCEAASLKDRRLRVIEGGYADYSEGLNAALEAAKGSYFFILLPRFALKNNSVAVSAAWAKDNKLDTVIIDASGRFCMRVIQAMDQRKVSARSLVQAPCSYGPVNALRAGEFLFNMGSMNLSSKLFRTQYIRSHNITFASKDGIGGNIFFARVMLSNPLFGYRVVEHLERYDNEFRPNVVPFVLDVHKYDSQEDATLIESAFAVRELCSKYRDTYLCSIANLLLDAFTVDLESRRTVESLEAYCKDYLSLLEATLSQLPMDGLKYYSVDAYNNYQILCNEGFSGYISRQFLSVSNERDMLRRSLDDFLRSKKYQLGEQFGDLAKKLLPNKIVARVRAAIAMR